MKPICTPTDGPFIDAARARASKLKHINTRARQGYIYEAIDNLQQFFADEPEERKTNTVALHLLGHLLSEHKRFAEALSVADELMQSPFGGEFGHRLRVEVLIERKKPEVFRAIDEWQKAFPHQVKVKGRRLQALLLFERFEETNDLADVYLQAEPGNTVYMNMKAEALMRLGYSDDALEILNKSRGLRELNARMHSLYARILADLNRHREALHYLQVTIARDRKLATHSAIVQAKADIARLMYEWQF